MFTIAISKIVGAAKKDSWSQVHTFEPTGKKKIYRGTLLLVISLQAQERTDKAPLDIASFGKEIIQRFHENYYGNENQDISVLSHLGACVDTVVREFEAVKAQVVAGVVLPTELPGKIGVLYLAAVGTGSVVVLRNERVYRTLGSDLETKEKMVAASGFVNEDDIFLFGTGDFFDIVGPSALKNALLSKDPVEVSSILAPQVHGKEESSGVAAVVVRIRKRLRGRQENGLDEDIEEKGALASDIERGVGGILSDLRGRGVFSVLRRFLSRSALLLSRRRGVQDEIVVRTGEDRQRRLMFSVAFILLLLLFVSVFFGWRRRVEERREQTFSEVWDVVEHQYQEAIDLTELNPLRSRALLSQAQTKTQDTISDLQDELSKAHLKRLRERLSEIEALLEQVSGEHRIDEAQVFLDLTLVRDDTYGENLGLHEETLVVLDRASDVLLRIGVDSKSAGSVGGGSLLSGSQVASAYSGRGFVVSDHGVVEVSLSGKTSAVVVEPEPEWGEIVDIEVFGGNLYLLDRGRSEIFRYQGVEGGFGPRRRWLGEGVLPDFSGAVAMAIDGDIWVLSNEDVLRFRRGVAEPFSIASLEQPLSDPLAIDTEAESERIYILDRGNRRVVVFDKSGEYRDQYLWDGIETVSDMVVSEEEGKILLLSGSVIYEIELQ